MATIARQWFANGPRNANSSAAGTCERQTRPMSPVDREHHVDCEWRKDEQMNTQSTRMAVITGASSGIGAVYADRLARRGYDLLLVARNDGAMAELAKKVVSKPGRNIEILAADLTDSNDLAKLERILREDSRVSLLLNNAGTGATAPLLNSDVADMSRMIALNVEAVTRLTYAAVPAFVKRGAGTIINIASIVAIAPSDLMACTVGPKRLFWLLVNLYAMNSATLASKFRSYCPVRPPISGKSPGNRSSNYRPKLSCQRRTWWMRRLPA